MTRGNITTPLTSLESQLEVECSVSERPEFTHEKQRQLASIYIPTRYVGRHVLDWIGFKHRTMLLDGLLIPSVAAHLTHIGE